MIKLNKYQLIAAPMMALFCAAGANAALPCLTCDMDTATPLFPVQGTQALSTISRYRVPSADDAVAAAAFGFAKSSRMINGDDLSRLSLSIEKNFRRKRKQTELSYRGAPRAAAGSIMHMVYDVRPSDSEQFLLSFSGGRQRPAALSTFRHAKPSMTQMLSIGSAWIHDNHWRTSLRYAIDKSQSHRAGLTRSIQLATGSLPTATVLAAALDYSPNFARAEALRFGIEARADHLSSRDAFAMASAGRLVERVSLRASIDF